MKKILFVLSNSLGWKTYQRQLIEAARVRDDIEASFYFCQPSLLQRLAMRRLPGRRLRRLADPIFIWRHHLDGWWRDLDSDKKYDAVHVATQVNALAFAELRDGPPFSLMIDQPRISPRSHLEEAWFSQRSLAAERQIFEHACFIGSMSEWAKKALLENYSLECDKIPVIPPSVNVPEYLGRNKLPGDLVDIAFVGNDFVRKGGDLLLALHQKRLANLSKLHIVSNGFSNGSGYKNVVHHRHIRNELIIDDFLAKMDLFCLPTRSDQSPWVCAEACAAGLPIVATRVGGVPAFCVDGKTGYLVEREDLAGLEERLTGLVSDPSLRQRMGREAHSFASRNLNARLNYNSLIDLIVQNC